MVVAVIGVFIHSFIHSFIHPFSIPDPLHSVDLQGVECMSILIIHMPIQIAPWLPSGGYIRYLGGGGLEFLPGHFILFHKGDWKLYFFSSQDRLEIYISIFISYISASVVDKIFIATMPCGMPQPCPPSILTVAPLDSWLGVYHASRGIVLVQWFLCICNQFNPIFQCMFPWPGMLRRSEMLQACDNTDSQFILR